MEIRSTLYWVDKKAREYDWAIYLTLALTSTTVFILLEVNFGPTFAIMSLFILVVASYPLEITRRKALKLEKMY